MFKYLAFISYNSKDYKWGKKLQNKLEHYKLPSTLCHEHGLEKYPVKPVFFAPTDIQPGDLTEELKKRLQNSKHLIVICSPSSAKSKWVSQEIEYFYKLGRSKNIHLFIISGTPDYNSKTNNCFNPILQELGLPEILGANINEKISFWPWINKERAYIQLISKLLNLEFDTLWNRHKRNLRIKITSIILSIFTLISVGIGIRLISLPTDINISFKEVDKNSHLPNIDKATIVLFLDNEVKYDTINSFAEKAIFKNIPQENIGKNKRVLISSNQYITIDTSLTIDKNINIQVKRKEEYYGSIRFKFWHPHKTISNRRVLIGDIETTCDSAGFVSLDIPIDKQRISYPIKLFEDQLVDSILVMPSGNMRVIEVK